MEKVKLGMKFPRNKLSDTKSVDGNAEKREEFELEFECIRPKKNINVS